MIWKRIILILAFILCLGFLPVGRGSSDGYDAEDSEDHRGSGENESVVYGSTDDGQDKESVEIDKDNPAKQLDTVLLRRCVYRNMKSLRLMIVTIRLPRGIGILTETRTA